MCKISKANEFWLARCFNIYIKVGDPRTKKLIVFGILILSFQDFGGFFVLCLGIFVLNFKG